MNHVQQQFVVPAIILFGALFAIVDPAAVLRDLAHLTTGIRAFQQILQGDEPEPEPLPMYDTPRARRVVRAGGAMLAISAFLTLAGFAA